jgi:TRAP-type uncharacterized transport system fused permease subunit
MSEESEVSVRKLSGIPGIASWMLAVGLSLYSLLWVVTIIQPQVYRVSFLLAALVLIFLIYPARQGQKLHAVDGLMIGLTLIAFVWPLLDFRSFIYRAAEPGWMDLVGGTLAIVIVLEATRRTVGWVLPISAIVFILYGYYGPLLDRIGLGLFAHRGYPLDRLVGSLYMTLEGIFGVPLDVTVTYIVLFAIYGACSSVLRSRQLLPRIGRWQRWAAREAAQGPGRTVTVAGFLLGTVSGSGVATTVTLGAVAWPLLKGAGYPAEVGGAILSAGGIGAILSPPTLGAGGISDRRSS